MPRLRSNDIDSPQDSIYGCGLCHLHALAACQVHEGPQGRFLVVEDHDELQWASEDDPDDYIPAVVHIYSLHETPSGTVARDILATAIKRDSRRAAKWQQTASVPSVKTGGGSR